MSIDKDMTQIRRALFGTRNDNGALYATIKSVDESKRTCTVADDNDMTYDDVLLYSIESPDLKGRVVIPVIGSRVLVSRIGASNELYLAMYSEIDKILLTIGDNLSVTTEGKGIALTAQDTTLKATDTGLTLTRGSAGLKKTLAALCDALTKLTVSTAVGASSVPINAADFTQIKQELNNYLEE